MSETVYDTISLSCGLPKSKLSEEEQEKIETFVSDPKCWRLLVTREDETDLRVIVDPSNSELISTKHILFVKIKDAVGNSVVINNSDEDIETIERLGKMISKCDGTQSSLMSILSDMRNYAKSDSIMDKLGPLRQEFFDKLLLWSEDFSILENRSRLSLLEQISMTKARSEKMKAVMKVCDTLFRDLTGYQRSRKNMEQIVGDIENESSTLFRKWCSEWSTASLLDPQRPCIETDPQTQIPKVTFDSRLVALASESRTLQCLGYSLPEEIVKLEKDLDKYSSIARELGEVVNFYCTIGDQILICQRPMLIESAKAFTRLLKFRNKITWNLDHNELVSWLSKVKSYARKFDQQNRLLRRCHYKVLRLVINLFDIPYNKWKPILDQISMVLYDVDTKYKETLSWKKHWDYQLYKILEYHFLQAVVKCDQWLGLYSNPFVQDSSGSLIFGANLATSEQFRVDLCFNNGKLCFLPSFEEIQSKIYNRIRRFISIFVNFKGFASFSGSSENHSTTPNLFSNIYLINHDHIPLLYEQAKSITDELLEIQLDFREWTNLYYLVQPHGHNLDSLVDILSLESLNDYRQNLILIKSKAQEFTRRFIESELECCNSNITVNLIPIKVFIGWLHDEMERILIHLLKQDTKAVSKELDDFLTDLLLKLTKPPDKVSSLVEMERIWYKEIPSLRARATQMYERLDSQHNFLLKWSAKRTQNEEANVMFEKYDQFSNIVRNRESVFEAFKANMESKVRSRIQDATEEAKLVTKRWTSSKSSAKVSEGSPNQEVIRELKSECDLLAEELSDLLIGCEYFSISVPESFSKFQVINQEIVDAYTKFTLLREFEEGMSSYLEMEWIIARHKLNSIENYLKLWINDHPECEDPVLKSKLVDWGEFIQVLKICRGESFAVPHWQQFINLIELHSHQTVDMENLKFAHLVAQKSVIMAKREAIKQLNDQANREQSVRETFDELDTFANQAKFDLYQYSSGQVEVKLIKNWRSILNQISESLLTLSSLKGSDLYGDHFAGLTAQWEQRISSLDMVISRLNSVQRKWTYLEPIFSNNSQSDVFSDESFSSASTDLISILKTVEADPHVFRLTRISGLLERLDSINSVLKCCQKRLAVFMEESRERFPRFYFLADDELLQVLAGKTSIREASLLRKLFNNTINRIHFEGNSASRIESPEGEMIRLRQPVPINFDHGSVEIERWLSAISLELGKTLKVDLFDWLNQSKTRSEEMIFSAPSQVVNLIQWIRFTSECETAIRRGRLKSLKEEFGRQIGTLIQEVDKIQEKILKIKIHSMITDLIHFVSVIQALIDENVSDVEDWRWQKHLRYYTDLNGEKVNICMGLSNVDYSFNYIGCFGSSKLVQTPLTDKCYMVCMEALSQGLGGNPYGPAGTGKTETVKALGQRLGRHVLVFNCDESLDVKSLTRILIGVVKCGFWGCFDEFNRLQVQVLSSLSSQIQAIQHSLRNRLDKVILPLIGETQINQDSGIFVTLNPAGKNYKGRNELPDNLKALFMPIAMTVPDSNLISRVLLLSEGFGLNHTEELGNKITAFFEIAKDSMSDQRHYDWSLRAIKSSIISAGKIMREAPENIEDETLVIIQALGRQIRSKLVDQDQRRFQDMLQDVFGSESVRRASIKPLVNPCDLQVLTDIAKEMDLKVDEAQIAQVLELEEQSSSRLGVIIIGPSGTGKTTVWQMLARFKSRKQSITVNPILINPKAVTRAQLFGFIDSETREWHDGVLTRVARSISRDESQDHFWIVFDGDIDPEWIEALNSVLDDNRVLTLPTGERIDFHPERVSLIFETKSLQFASPATISRVGIISLTTSQLANFIEKHVLMVKQSSLSTNQVEKLAKNSLWPMSTAQTAISLIKHASSKEKDPNSLLLLLDESPNLIEPKMKGRFVMTSSTSKAVALIEILNQCSKNHLLILGGHGVGKSTLAEELTLGQANATVVKIFCGPNTDSLTLIDRLKSQGVLSNLGSSRILSAPSNKRIVIFVRNLQLLHSDQWSSMALIAFLTHLVKNNGFYDPLTTEWVSLESFQIVATCSLDALSNIDHRFVSVMNIIKIPDLPINEIETILQLCCPRSSQNSWAVQFSSGFTKVYQEISHFSKLRPILPLSKSTISQIQRYDEVESAVLSAETYRAIHADVDEDQDRRLKSKIASIFVSKDVRSMSYPHETKPQNLRLIQTEEAHKLVDSTLKDWIDQVEVRIPFRIALVSEFVELFAEVACYLSEITVGCKGLLILGPSASGRKMACKALANYFGYDVVWTPRSHQDKQLQADLKALVSPASGDSDPSEQRKVLLLVDQIHFRLIPTLNQSIYNLLLENTSTNVVRVVMMFSHLNSKDASTWSRACRITRVRPWSTESLHHIPPVMLENARGFSGTCFPSMEDEFWKETVETFKKLRKQALEASKHSECRQFLSLIEIYAIIKARKFQRLTSHKSRLETGVLKLEEASNQVSKLKTEAEEQQKVLNEKRADADQALDMITSSMHSSEDQKLELEEIKVRTEKESVRLGARKAEIELELKQVEPILQAAKAAVGGIKSEALSEIKALRAPPEVIRDILEGVIRLMGVHDTSWGSMKSFLSRRGIRDDIMNFDARKITPINREKVEHLLSIKSGSFEEAQAKRASVAAVPLANWVKANLAFAKILHKIKPLEDEQNRLEAGLRSAQSRMKTLTSELEGVESHVGVLKDRLNQMTLEAAQIEVNLKGTNQVLIQSQNLLTDLNDEFQRWKSQMTEIDDFMAVLDRQSMVTSFYVNFIASNSSNGIKMELLQECCETFTIQKFDFASFLDFATEDDLFWHITGTFTTPLFIEPGLKSWPKLEKTDFIDVTRIDWIKRLELCLRFGKIAVLENLSDLNFHVSAVMRREVLGGDGSRNCLVIGDRKVDLNENFQMNLKISQIQERLVESPFIRVVNMAPSKDTTACSLLSLTISIRRPELEDRKKELESNKMSMKKQLKELEDELLKKLNASSGSFLNDFELIAGLKATKNSAKAVEKSLNDLLKVDQDLNQERNQYQSLANLGCDLFLYTRELVNLNPMYIFGIQEFESLYTKCLKIHRNISEHRLMVNVYNYISQALFPLDRLTFQRFLEESQPNVAQGADLQVTRLSLKNFLKDCLESPESQRLVLIITQPGADPTSEIREVASQMTHLKPVFISMGSSMIDQVDSLISNPGSSFVCLSNCHLVVDWLPQLRIKLDKLFTDDESIDRLESNDLFVVLVTHAHEQFPSTLLDMCLKYVYTSSPGLRSLIASLEVESAQWDESERLAYLHSVCCERRNYLPIGWTKNYDFGFNDYKTVLNALQRLKTRRDRRIQLQYIKGILESAFYGAKLDTKMDIEMLGALIRHWFSLASPVTKEQSTVDEKDELALIGLPINLTRWHESLCEEKVEKGLKIMKKALKKTSESKEIENLRQNLLGRSFGPFRGRSSRVLASAHSRASPLQEFIQAEQMAILSLIEKIKNDLENPGVEITGSLALNETPECWFSAWNYGPKRSNEFVESVLAMYQQSDKLLVSAEIDEYDLSQFLRPASLLNSFRQKVARQLNVNVDRLSMDCSWSDHQFTKADEDNVRVKLFGMSIEGALFDGSGLRDCTINSGLQNTVPPLTLSFRRKESSAHQELSIVKVPLYGSSAREQVVAWFDLPCSTGTQDYWIMRGVALVINYAR